TFDDAKALIYHDLVRASLNEAARRALESFMETKGYEYQSEFARKYFGEGKAEGKAEGEAEGEAKGKAEVVLKQLQLKFGGVPEAVVERVRSASVEELDGFAERILFAESIDDVLG
ncbi:MAG: DUF4351 domain-containing protein, partial [Myxococcales bacterium]|nr:DUF4351 domain-containing protein [Myxococcales bacterium]